MTERKTSDRDVNRAIRSWLHEDRHEDVSRVAGAVLDQVDTIPQRRATWWPTRRTPIMNKFVMYGLAAVAAVAVVFFGAQLLGSPTGGLGSQATATPTPSPTATPTPGAATIASGSFTVPLGEFGEAVDIEAVRTGNDVSGTMEISNPAGAEGAYSVDLECGGTTDEGFHLIGGKVTESTYTEFIEDGAYVVIALAPGTPVRMLWAADVLVSDEVPAPAESCSAFVDSLLSDPESIIHTVDIHGRPIDGDLELGQ